MDIDLLISFRTLLPLSEAARDAFDSVAAEVFALIGADEVS